MAPYMWNLKRNDTNVTKQKKTHRLKEPIYGCRVEGQGKGMVREFRTEMYTLLYLKRMTTKALLYTTGNSAQCYLAA